jgi:hypothetical protein
VSLKATWYRDKLRKKARQGLQGFPLATVIYYGPDDKRASKVAVAIIMAEEEEPAFLERWLSDTADVRLDPTVNEAIVRFIQKHGAKSVVSPERILGCPHEEGSDYPKGKRCPRCSFWARRDRLTGELLR